MRVNIDDKILTDSRMVLAAAGLGVTLFEFIGRCIAVWMAAYHNRSAIMPRRNVDALAQCPGFVDAMLAEDLATPVDDDLVMVRLRGVTARIEFLELQDAKREKANAAKREKAGLPPACPPGPPRGRHPGLPYSLTPSPSPSQDQTHTQAQAHVGSAPGKPARKPKRVRSVVPLDWKPRAEERTLAAELGVDADREAVQFMDHHAAKGTVFADHHAAFRTWIRNAQRFSKASNSNSNGKATSGRAEPSDAATFAADAQKTANGGVPW